MDTIWIVSPPNYIHSQCFDEIALGLRSAFRVLGIEAPIVRNAAQLGDKALVLGANLLDQVPVPSSARLVLFNLEQITPYSAWLTEAYLGLLRRYPVWDYSERNITALARLGIRATFCGIGYVPELARIPAAPEDIDVLFVGSINARRKAVLQEISRRGAKLEVAFGVYGEARDQLIARSKLVLNVHYYDARLLEIVRVSYLLANRKCVVSEAGADTAYEAQFVPGVSFAPYYELPNVCARLLSDPAERQTLAQNGFERMSSLSQVDYLRRALDAG
jgi:hypothetical protein